ncbi:MAG: Binding-protein-dependent transport systems inner membrane component [Synergistales bacterium 58_81]|nr:MAG: Binding-protein-dependent transport systems inner membrane component [Synergistales bacterium 58_81]
MMKIPRWSFITFFLILAVAVIGPMSLSKGPQETVAKPFAPPVWSGGDAPPPFSGNLSPASKEMTIEWDWDAPENLTLRGQLAYDKEVTARLVWTTPEGSKYTLSSFQGSGVWSIDLDARDMTFKTALGIPPFAGATSLLFPSRGLHVLSLEGPSPSEGSLELVLPGGRWGLLGTDQRGRDVLSLFIVGIRVSLLVGISATLIASLLGLSIGLASGYLGGVADNLIMRVVDVLLSIPILPILMVLVGIWGKGLWQLVLILGLFSWMGTARTVRSLALSLRESCYVENLRSIGAGSWYILYRHLLPEAMPVVLAAVSLGVPGAILAEAGLSFLGLSDPRIISWGRMLHEAHGFGAFTAGAWWLIIPPGLGISIICLVFLDMGRSIEEMADPRLRGGGKS